MALFKILRGPSSELTKLPFNDGWCYFTPDTGLFHIDYNGNRVPLNAQDAATLAGATLAHVLNDSELEIPSSALIAEIVNNISDTIAGKQDVVNGEEGQLVGFDANGKLVAVASIPGTDGIIDQNSGALVKLWHGTTAGYEALEEIDENTIYILSDELGGDIEASTIQYYNGISGLAATTVQDAIDEIFTTAGKAGYVLETNKGLQQKFWRGTKNEYEELEFKDEDTMYIILDEDGEGVVSGVNVNADWNQNDETAPNYVKNRPFYSETPQTLIEEQSVTTVQDGNSAYAQMSGSLYLTVGETYKVVFNGTTYECVAYGSPDWEAVCIGNGSIIGVTGGNGEPFCIDSYSSGDIHLDTAEAGTHIVSISSLAEEIHQIDPKYLPNSNVINGSGSFSIAEGESTTASGRASHAEGYETLATSNQQHVQGKYNIADSNNIYTHIVGNGESDAARSNAHTLDWDGNAWFAGDVYVGSTSGTNKDEGSKKLATEEFVETEVAALVGSAPETLDTIEELATALNNNKDIITVLNDSIATKANKTEVYTKTEVDALLVNYYTKAQVDAAITAAIDEAFANIVRAENVSF